VGIELPEGDWDTVGGLMFHALGHVPAEGETVTIDGHLLRAERVQGRRIGRVHLRPALLDDDPAAASAASAAAAQHAAAHGAVTDDDHAARGADGPAAGDRSEAWGRRR
jgi:hypothetical protein